MNITCEDIIQLDSFQRIRLVAGERGLYRRISWPFICVTPTISQWLHGGELLFVSGSGFQDIEATLDILLSESIKQNLSGMVILVGGDSIARVPDRLCRIADESCFPLFEMPWEIKLVDLTKEIAELIIEKRESINRTNLFLEQVLFSPDGSGKFGKLSTVYNIQIRPYHFVCIMQPDHIESVNGSFSPADFFSKFSFYLKTNIKKPVYTIMPLQHLSTLIVLIMTETIADAYQMAELLTSTFCMLQDQFYLGCSISLALGSINASDISPSVSFKEAILALEIITKSFKNEKVAKYWELGIYRLLFSGSKKEDLWAYSHNCLKPLLQEDKSDEKVLLDTLRCYLANNGNLVSTSRQLFIHRNTLIYRINSIKYLLGRDLSNALVRNDLFNCILTYDLLSNDK